MKLTDRYLLLSLDCFSPRRCIKAAPAASASWWTLRWSPQASPTRTTSTPSTDTASRPSASTRAASGTSQRLWFHYLWSHTSIILRVYPSNSLTPKKALRWWNMSSSHSSLLVIELLDFLFMNGIQNWIYSVQIAVQDINFLCHSTKMKSRGNRKQKQKPKK